jgi:Tol biopolymer transport system component
VEAAQLLVNWGGQIQRYNGSTYAGFEYAAAWDVALNSDGSVLAGAAYFVGDNEIYMNGAPLRVSPASEFGPMNSALYVTQLQVSPNGRYVAFILESESDYNQFGVWVYDLWTNQSWQMFRNDVANGRRARRLFWAPNSTVVLIELSTPAGTHYTYLGVSESADVRNNQANAGYQLSPYQDAVWSLDSASIVVSGLAYDDPARGVSYGQFLGRIQLLQNGAMTFYNFSSAGISYTRAAADVGGGQIAFLGSNSPDGPYRLYVMTPPGVPVAVTREIPGRVVSWDWSPRRSALMVITNSSAGRKLWLVRPNGTVSDLGNAPISAQWQ